jgi:hypothetical protein
LSDKLLKSLRLQETIPFSINESFIELSKNEELLPEFGLLSFTQELMLIDRSIELKKKLNKYIDNHTYYQFVRKNE